MSSLPITFNPPQNWQDFEKLLLGLAEVKWEQSGYQMYGRSGQDQSGIDIYGYDNEKIFIGIQCKLKSDTDKDGKLLTSSLLKESMVKDEIAKAEKISKPKIERYLFATTSSRDTKIQDVIRNINHQRIKNNKFSVEIWFWEDIEIQINRFKQLQLWYYEEFLNKIGKNDKELSCLFAIRQAFNRPAFQRDIGAEESSGDFIQAIKDTAELLTTGKLYSRRGELITQSYTYVEVVRSNWITTFDTIQAKLNEIRTLLAHGLRDKLVIQHGGCVEFKDLNISKSLNEQRRYCLVELNKIFDQMNIPKVKSEII